MPTFILCTNILLKRNIGVINQNVFPLINTSSHGYKVITTLINKNEACMKAPRWPKGALGWPLMTTQNPFFSLQMLPHYSHFFLKFSALSVSLITNLQTNLSPFSHLKSANLPTKPSNPLSSCFSNMASFSLKKTPLCSPFIG